MSSGYTYASIGLPRHWGTGGSASADGKCARVAVARKLAALLHRLWQHDEEFRWQTV